MWTYVSGTSTLATTYFNADLDPSHANTNPIILDSAGRATIFLPPAAFRFELQTAAGVTVKTQDDISQVPPTAVSLDIDGTAGEALSAGNAVYLSDGSGGTTAGRWYKTDADNTYSSVTAQSVGMAVADIASGASGTIRLQGSVTGLSGLVAGTVYYLSATAGAITSSAPANARVIGQADTTTSLVLSGAVSPPFATAAVAGIVSTTTQTFGGPKTFQDVATFTVAPVGTVRVCVSTADLTKNNNTTLADITGLAIAIGANETLQFEFYLRATSGVTPNYKFAITGPAAPTSVLYGIESQGFPNQNIATAFAGAINTAGLGTGNPQSLMIRGRVVNAANAGTLQLQMAQQTADASDTKVITGSYGRAVRTA